MLKRLKVEIARMQEISAEYGGGEKGATLASVVTAPERQALSEAVQVLSAMALEGAINLLAIRILGEGDFKQRFERKPLREKLAEVVKRLPALSQPELSSILRRVTTARNALVHPKPIQGGWGSAMLPAADNLAAAESVLRDARRFLEILDDNLRSA